MGGRECGQWCVDISEYTPFHLLRQQAMIYSSKHQLFTLSFTQYILTDNEEGGADIEYTPHTYVSEGTAFGHPLLGKMVRQHLTEILITLHKRQILKFSYLLSLSVYLSIYLSIYLFKLNSHFISVLSYICPYCLLFAGRC